MDKILPKKEEIPEEFWQHRGTVWNKMVSTWFFLGLKNLELEPREGVDQKLALRHIQAIMGSFAPKHEHKEAACAYLLSKYFQGIPKYEPKKSMTGLVRGYE